jgi:serine protease Do
MKKSNLFIAIFILIGAIFGSFFTYNYVLKDMPPRQVQAEPSQTPETDSPVAIAINVPGGTSVADAFKKVSPSVVFITTRSVFQPRSYIQIPRGLPEEFRDFFMNPYEMPNQQRQGSGSGIIISSDGLILTNQHVIEGAQEISVKVQKKDGSEETYNAKVIGQDKLSDVAVLKIEAKNLPAASLGNSDKTPIGEWVIAVGNPYGYEHTVTVGVISAKGRNLALAGREYPDLLQTDAAINPGNSGGPLLNLKGEVIGINTAIHSRGQGIGFAIPINWFKEIRTQLIEQGRVVRPYIGIQMMEMDDSKSQYLGMPKTEGVLIYSVLRGSPANNAGLQRGDVILEVEGKKVNTPKELQNSVRARKVGDNVKMKVWRDRKFVDVELKVTEMPADTEAVPGGFPGR